MVVGVAVERKEGSAHARHLLRLLLAGPALDHALVAGGTGMGSGVMVVVVVVVIGEKEAAARAAGGAVDPLRGRKMRVSEC